MKNIKNFFLPLLLISFLASCQFHQGQFTKRKYLDLKKMESKVDIIENNEETSEIEKVETPIDEKEISSISQTSIEPILEESIENETRIDEVKSSEIAEIESVVVAENLTSSEDIHQEKIKNEPKNSNIRKIHNALFWISVTLLIACLVFLIWTSITGGIGVLILMFLCLFGWVFFVIIQFFVSFKVPKDQRGPFFKVQQIYAYIVVALAVIPIIAGIVLLIMDIFGW
jgi:uncharacterized membrane-anchored protein